MTITIQEAEKLRAENIRLRENRERACEMLAVAASYIEGNCPDQIIYYDESDCDGYCVAEDCLSARDALQGDTPPSPDVPAFDAWYQTRFAPIPPQTREYQMAKAAFAAGQASVKGGE